MTDVVVLKVLREDGTEYVIEQPMNLSIGLGAVLTYAKPDESPVSMIRVNIGRLSPIQKTD